MIHKPEQMPSIPPSQQNSVEMRQLKRKLEREDQFKIKRTLWSISKQILSFDLFFLLSATIAAFFMNTSLLGEVTGFYHYVLIHAGLVFFF